MKIQPKDIYLLDVKSPAMYSMDGCQNGDLVTIKEEDLDEMDLWWVDIIRQDGTKCEDFLVSKSDLKQVIE